jgi:hypothetical protein
MIKANELGGIIGGIIGCVLGLSAQDGPAAIGGSCIGAVFGWSVGYILDDFITKTFDNFYPETPSYEMEMNNSLETQSELTDEIL